MSIWERLGYYIGDSLKEFKKSSYSTKSTLDNDKWSNLKHIDSRHPWR